MKPRSKRSLPCLPPEFKPILAKPRTLALFYSRRRSISRFFFVREYPANRQLVDVHQFFLLRKFRRQGVGIEALHQGVRQHPGQWQIRVLKQNLGALKFWRSAVTALVGSRFDAGMGLDIDLEMHFIRFRKASKR